MDAEFAALEAALDSPITEGHCGQWPEQAAQLRALAGGRRRVAEIGFNAGHSALAILGAEGVGDLTSFDVGAHEYLAAGKAHVDATHPGRHTLVLGDSRATLPAFAREHGRVFDCVFVDGDHGVEGAWADLRNTVSVAEPGALVIMDDMQYAGPQQAWARALREGWVRETGGTDHGTRMRWGLISPDPRVHPGIVEHGAELRPEFGVHGDP